MGYRIRGSNLAPYLVPFTLYLLSFSTLMTDKTDQDHPQYKSDRAVVNQLLQGEVTDYNISELARLIIRYKGFPGARDIQRDLEKALQQVGLTEEELYAKTRQLHEQGGIYQNLGRNREDWS